MDSPSFFLRVWLTVILSGRSHQKESEGPSSCSHGTWGLRSNCPVVISLGEFKGGKKTLELGGGRGGELKGCGLSSVCKGSVFQASPQQRVLRQNKSRV